ncbi:hypothetical protein, partial [Phenylobacterium sp.]|uniref:hypothetical protein n=1 Tax=Phenylobacterium sp. TaxID=1871053 RepID=UPI002E34E70D
GYLLCVTGPDGVGETAPLEVESDRQAVNVAFLGCSTFGHSLWSNGRFLGAFAPGDGRIAHTRRSFFPPPSESHHT